MRFTERDGRSGRVVGVRWMTGLRSSPWSAAALVVACSLSATNALAQGAQQFDLHCDVIAVSTYDGERRSQAGTESFRIDLESGQFCSGSCEFVVEFRTPPTSSELNLTYEAHSGGERLGFDYVTTVNRRTGTMALRSTNGNFSETGQCRREPFSGFPEAMF